MAKTKKCSFTMGENVGASLDLIARETQPDQFLREYIWNGIGAGAKEIGFSELKIKGVNRLVYYDDGRGMGKSEMERELLKVLDPRSVTIGGVEHKTYGVGARATARVQSPLGVEYASLKNGKWNTLVIRWGEGGYSSKGLSKKLEKSWVVKKVEKYGHGTIALFYGHSESEPWDKEGVHAWVWEKISSRFLHVPKNVNVFTAFRRRKRKPGSKDANCIGILDYMSRDKVIEKFKGKPLTGKLEFEDFTAYWTIRKQYKNYHAMRPKYYVALGHEYEAYPNSVSGATRIHQCGIHSNAARAIIVFIPKDKPGVAKVEPDLGRSGLHYITAKGRQEIDVESMCRQFNNKMPKILQEWLKATGVKRSKRHYGEKLHELFGSRLNWIRNLLRKLPPTEVANGDSLVVAGLGKGAGSGAKIAIEPGEGKGRKPTPKHGVMIETASNCESNDKAPRKKRWIIDNLPAFQWLSSEGDNVPEGWFSEKQNFWHYNPTNNIFFVNNEHPVFKEMTKSLVEKYPTLAAREIEDVTKDCWEDSISSSTIIVRTLRRGEELASEALSGIGVHMLTRHVQDLADCKLSGRSKTRATYEDEYEDEYDEAQESAETDVTD